MELSFPAHGSTPGSTSEETSGLAPYVIIPDFETGSDEIIPDACDGYLAGAGHRAALIDTVTSRLTIPALNNYRGVEKR